jgi:hypothetical protein
MVEFLDTLNNKTISYHIDDKLVKIWDTLRGEKLMHLNEDRVYIVDGRERTGKSTFAFQQAKYIDPNFSIDQICLTSEQFLHAIRTSPRGKVIVFDEAFRGLSSKSGRSKINKTIVQALMEVGQRNLVIFIVLPTLFLLEIYAAVFRSEALFHVYKLKKRSPSGKKQRAFKIYNYEKKKQLYLRGKTKYFSYSKPKIGKQKGRFFAKQYEHVSMPYETFELDAYNKKKDDAFKESPPEEDPRQTKYLSQRNTIIRNLLKTPPDELKEHFKSQRKLSAWLTQIGVEISQQQIAKIVAETSEKPDL